MGGIIDEELFSPGATLLLLLILLKKGNGGNVDDEEKGVPLGLFEGARDVLEDPQGFGIGPCPPSVDVDDWLLGFDPEE